MEYQIAVFYQFRKLEGLGALKKSLLDAMSDYSIVGTVIIAEEGLNAAVCGRPGDIAQFVSKAEALFAAVFDIRYSSSEHTVFRRRKVKIKREIISLGQNAAVEKGIGTHVDWASWNRIISDPETVIVDARNDYEFRLGTFRNAVNPQTLSFRELPDFAERHLVPKKDKKIAMFCTGGIRCEKFAPYLKEKGFEEVYQLEGGILGYLERIDEKDSLWQGECFVFDERISLDEKLRPGSGIDPSLTIKSEQHNE